MSENHNIENARDIKEGLESPSARFCKIDSSKVCPGIAINKITGRLQSKRRENRYNPSQMEANAILVIPTHAWSLHVS